MRHSEIAVAYGRVDVVGNASDCAEGSTINLAIRGPNPTKEGGMAAWVRATPIEGGDNKLQIEGIRRIFDPNIKPAYDDPFLPIWRILDFAEADGVQLDLATTIPPKSGLGGSTATLVAALYALTKLLGKEWNPYVGAEAAQRADLRPGQVQGYQDPYASVFGGINFFDFSGKRIGRSMTGEGGVFDEPFATVESIAEEVWRALGVEILVAIPEGLDRISGDVNARVARRYLDGDETTVEQMKRKAELARSAKDCLIKGDYGGFWQAFDENTQVMNSWGWVTTAHGALTHAAQKLGAHAKVCGAAGAVAVFCEEGRDEEVAEKLRKITSQVYPVQVARGVRLEETLAI